MKLLAIPIEPQSDASTSEGGIWTNVYTGNWLSLEQSNNSVAAIGRIASGSNPTDVSDWWHFDAIPPISTSTDDSDVTLDSVLQITVTSDYGAWFLLWNSDGKSIGYGLATGRVATGYKWASDLLAEEGDVYIEIRPSAAALTKSGNNDYRIYVTRLYEACTSVLQTAGPMGREDNSGRLGSAIRPRFGRLARQGDRRQDPPGTRTRAGPGESWGQAALCGPKLRIGVDAVAGVRRGLGGAAGDLRGGGGDDGGLGLLGHSGPEEDSFEGVEEGAVVGEY